MMICSEAEEVFAHDPTECIPALPAIIAFPRMGFVSEIDGRLKKFTLMAYCIHYLERSFHIQNRRSLSTLLLEY